MPVALIISILMLVASLLLSMLLVKRNKPKPAGIEEFEFPQSDDGTPQAVIFGDAWATGPMVIWFGNYRTIKIKSKGGKK